MSVNDFNTDNSKSRDKNSKQSKIYFSLFTLHFSLAPIIPNYDSFDTLMLYCGEATSKPALVSAS